MRQYWAFAATALILALLFRIFIGGVYEVSSSNMLPSLYPFDSVFVLKTDKIKRGDVVVFHSPLDAKQILTARVLGVAGDKLWIHEGELILNDHIVQKHIPTQLKYQTSWLSANDFPGEGNGIDDFIHWQEALPDKEHGILLKKEGSLEQMPLMVIPENQFFMVGDNRSGSEDSRYWTQDKKFVQKTEILGRVERVLWSCEEKLSLVPFFCNPRKIRFGRLFLEVI